MIKKQQILSILQAGILVTVLLLGLNFVNATSPPDGNTPTPINVGRGDQIKSGILEVGGLSVYGGGLIGGSAKASKFCFSSVECLTSWNWDNVCQGITSKEPSFSLKYVMDIMGLNFVSAAWSDPTGTPTGNNTEPPINIGSERQQKLGGLSVNTLYVVGDGFLSGQSGSATAGELCLGKFVNKKWVSKGCVSSIAQICLGITN